jgi:hypothetical protein
VKSKTTGCCDGSLSRALLAAGAAVLVAVLCVGIDKAFGLSFDKWAPIAIAVIGGTSAVVLGGCCRRSCGREKKPKSSDSAEDQLSNWPSS